jgi:hypothetical protein
VGLAVDCRGPVLFQLGWDGAAYAAAVASSVGLALGMKKLSGKVEPASGSSPVRAAFQRSLVPFVAVVGETARA